MLKKLLSTATRPQLVNMSRYLFSSQEPPPTKLPKATDLFIYFNVKNTNGSWEKVPAIIGESIITSLVRMNIDHFRTDLCMGDDLVYEPHIRPHDPFSDGPMCGHCKIMLIDNWHEKVMTETDGYAKGEEMILISSMVAKYNSRLACCIPVEQWMDGMNFMIDPEPEQGGDAEVV